MSDLTTLPQPPQPGSAGRLLREFGEYVIEGELGRGGMGVVYLARQKDLNRRVALKMLTGHYGGDELQRFLEEAETAAGLNHTNIAHIYEVGEHDGAPFFSMEYVEGGSLADALRKEPLPTRTAAQLLIQVARALHYAHQHGVVHRDMKPANILLDLHGLPKVADFGIAKRLNNDNQLTRSGAVIGTPTYMAPEQAKGNSRHVGPAADVYSLGAILYEMLAGRPPFLPEDSEAAITVRVLTEDPVSPAWHRPNTPRDLETICMKCLEKEPRKRYATAADFAEDLRRFLDDESIQAKPASTVGSSIKWVRRHPWHSVGIAAGVVLAVALLAGLVRWELYSRSRLEYASGVEWINGGLEPVGKINQDKASHLAASLRLTRRGRLGNIIKVEVLNARGYPAVLRRIGNSEMIPIYIEGLTGLQQFTESQPETTTVEFSFDGNNPREATARDRNGIVTWRTIYDHRDDSGSLHSAGARFVNRRGFDAPSRDGASHLEFERDANGRDSKITFFNAAGKPAANGEGVYGYKLERDAAGRIVQLFNLGQDGQPAPNRAGLTALSLIWNAGGQVTRFEVRDAKGQPAGWNGISVLETEYDSFGNAVRVSNVGADGQPEQSAAAPWSVREMKRNDHGELTQNTFLKAEVAGTLKKISQTTIAYDQYGHPADMHFDGDSSWASGAPSWRTAWRRDANGNVTEEKFLDTKGQPVLNDKGYAIKRLTYATGPQGQRIEETYFNAAGERTYAKSGHHRLIDEYSTTGVLRRQTMEDHDPARFKYYRIVSEPEFDAQGRLRHSTYRFEDAQGQLATGIGLAYTATEDTYDENGHPTTEWMMGLDPGDAGGPISRIDTEWHSNGETKRRVRQLCDANRQPLSSLADGNAARREEEFDAEANRVRIYETGFDEPLVGFSTREAKFVDGNLQSVTHRRSDLTVVNSVRVIIMEITPPEKQPKSAEIRPGDQFVAVNGKTVTSSYAWVFAGSFPGGWIEVLREGRRIRIGSLNPGLLGVVLQDRAATQGT